MIINFNEDSFLSWGDSINLFEELEKFDKEGGTLINVDAFVATYFNVGSSTSQFVNFDDSDVTDGVISAKLRKSEKYAGVAYLCMRYKDRYGDFNLIEFNLTPISLRRIIEASNYNGEYPSDVSVVIDGIDGPIPTKNLLICANGKALPKSDDGGGIPVYGFDSYTCSYRIVNAIVESYACESGAKKLPPMKRYRLRSKWSEDFVDFVYSNHSGCYISSVHSRLVITGLESDGTIETDFMEYSKMPPVYSVFNRNNHDYTESLILKSVAKHWVGREFNGMSPVVCDDTFSFDKSQKEILYRFGYHDVDRLDAEEFNSDFTIGIEVEKEDYKALRSVCARDLFAETNWAKERDGSIDDEDGYELVSPTYDLMSDKLDNDIKNSTDLTNLINAKYSSACGGHIHLGSRSYSGNTFFDKISPWVPLIYSLYVGRIGRDYCKVKKNDGIKNSDDKYQAIRIFDNRIEFRIISAVKDVNTLIWRRDLMRIIVNNLDYTPMKIVGELLDQKSNLYAHLRKQYTPAQMTVKAKMYAYFASELLDDAYAVKQHVMNAVDYFSQSQIRHLKYYSFNVNE
jgi:hypothetical protein